MWDDFKKIAAVIVSLLREQKERFLCKLILVNYGNTREASHTRLGEQYFKAYKDGKITEVHDDVMAAELDSLLRAEEEIVRTQRDMDEIAAKYAAQRKLLLGQAGMWQRTGESMSSRRRIVTNSGRIKAESPPPEKKAGES